MKTSALLLLLLLSPRVTAGDELREGFIAETRSLAGGERIVTVEPRPAFSFLGAAGSPHPRVPPGPFEVVWTGSIEVREDEGPLTFSAHLAGEIELTIGGEKVLDARSTDPRARVRGRSGVKLADGLLPLRAVFRSLPDVSPRIQVLWEGERFAEEPLSPFRLKHHAADEPPGLAEEVLRERGRSLAGSLGCARCHADAFPASGKERPGPSLADASRIERAWIARWLADPRRVKPRARMPALFAPGREGRLERELVARRLAPGPPSGPQPAEPGGNHRMGKRRFHSLGCAACHFLPDLDPDRQQDLGRIPLEALERRLPAPRLAAFLRSPRARFPDGRMPDFRLDEGEARDLEAYILLWAKDGTAPPEEPVPEEEVLAFARRLGARDADAAADEIIRRKGCARCHDGIGEPPAEAIGIREGREGCLGGDTLPRFSLGERERTALALHLSGARSERHASPAFEARRLLEARRCDQCHPHAGLGPSPLEEVGATLGGSNLERVPYLRAPRILDPVEKYERGYLLDAIRNGLRDVRGSAYTYRMPSHGDGAEALALALAARDGGDPAAADPPPEKGDPTLRSVGGTLVGFEGYSCISCHLWKGKFFHEPDPGSMGPELSSATKRLRRAWLERWLGDPARYQPGTPMPQLLPRGERASLRAILGGDSRLQGDAIREFLALGRDAPDPAPLPPIPIPPPGDGSARVALIPVRLPGGDVVESLTIQSAAHDMLVLDAGSGAPRGLFAGARLLRRSLGRLRFYEVDGEPVAVSWEAAGGDLIGHDRLRDGARIRRRDASGPRAETLRFSGRTLVRERGGEERTFALPPAKEPPVTPRRAVIPGEPREGSLERPGYRAVAYPRPKLPNGEDLLMPSAVAVDPRDGRVFVASMKLGRIFLVDDPAGDGTSARYIDWTGGLFQDALSLHAEPGELWVLHRRNLTRVSDSDGDGLADRFDRALALPHGIADDYDLPYGLIRERGGAFVFGYAPYAHRKIEGSGGGVRVMPGGAYRPDEIASGLRNPVGWCAGPEGDVFCTDNQGEWVATNKLCHADGGRYHGFPNPERPPPDGKPRSPPAVWVPYDWAHSLNGVTFDGTGGKFGPFAGQFFIAELMFGGAIIRASVEKVGGEWQGACFPFWGKGLLGPLYPAFGPDGRLWVGSITEPGWMAQPDRGGLFRIEFTGQIPFEMETIRIRPRGFRVVFTRKLDPRTAGAPSFEVESWRYEHTGAYGSPEYDRVPVKVLDARPGAGGLEVHLELGDLRTGRVYKVAAPGVRSSDGEPLVHDAGVYTLNAVPAE